MDVANVRVAHLHHAITPDGILIALGTDGAIWLYSVAQDHWLCVPIGTLGALRVLSDSTGDNAAVLTLEGVLIWLDLAAARKLLAEAPPRI